MSDTHNPLDRCRLGAEYVGRAPRAPLPAFPTVRGEDPMQIGVTYPQTEIETDPGAVAQFGRAAEELGFSHILAYDHVLGADRSSRPGTVMPYGLEDPFHEPLVLFSFLTAHTT